MCGVTMGSTCVFRVAHWCRGRAGGGGGAEDEPDGDADRSQRYVRERQWRNDEVANTDMAMVHAGNEIGADGARAVAETLKVNQIVAQIVLSSKCNDLNENDASEFSDVVMACVGGEIGNEGARAVAEALKMNQTVIQIVLRSTCRCGSDERTLE